MTAGFAKPPELHHTVMADAAVVREHLDVEGGVIVKDAHAGADLEGDAVGQRHDPVGPAGR